ncbi:MAG: T9SS type A sorting domain-containing protein [Bacteroidia bacterium]|nr:T9SS type A sorting domain-containing protein [Bacteroidia bacterium]
MKITPIFTLVLCIILFFQGAMTQNCANQNIQLQADIPSACNTMVMTMQRDLLNRPYLYVANKEAGLTIYDITSLSSPVWVANVPTTQFDSLHVMSLSQAGNYLYLALGNHFTDPQQAGMAIVDVTNPLSPAVTDYYVVPGSGSGGGIVKVEGNYAYLGAMKSGLVILDISSKTSIQSVSQFIPSINFPPINNPNPNFYNARGMQVKNSIVYLCYDGGGLRIVNCTNKTAPKETGRWCNPVMYTPLDHPKAYNNIVVADTLAYLAVDYAGMEIVSIADTDSITLKGWWNPYNAPNNNWFTSPVHANEMHYEPLCQKMFLSVGKSDMIELDVSDPALPDSCNVYGGVSNSIGTWGISGYQNEIYLSYICVPFPNIPFPSNWTGVKILTYTPCQSLSAELDQKQKTIKIFPNPASNRVKIDLPENEPCLGTVLDTRGRKVAGFEGNEFSVAGLSPGLYILKLETPKGILVQRFIRE